MDRFAAIDAFVRVAEAQSFAEAARQLRVSRSVITTRIRQLEEFVGAPLFHRTTRSVRLSELGDSFLPDCVDLVRRSNEVVDQLREIATSPVGRLRIHALPGFVLGHLAILFQEFQARYPQILLDIVVNDAALDPVKEGFDCALQIFPPRSEELIARRLFPVRRIFCATPAYLKEHGEPKVPRDLLKHRLCWYSGYPTRDRVVFHGGDGPVSLDLKPTLLSNSVHLLREAALEDGGIVCLPTLVAADAVLDGRLCMVMSERQLSSFWLSVFYPSQLRRTLKLKLLLELLSKQFSGVPPWDQALIDAGLLSNDVID